MIPVSEPSFGEEELTGVLECVRTGWVSSTGSFIEKFEEKWAVSCGRRYGVAVSSGTTALHLAVACLELAPGDEVIMPTFTIVSCALAVVYNGAVPVLVDCDPATWCMNVGEIEAKITPRTRAIMPVHIYGHPVDMDAVESLASRYGLSIIEDAAEAHGAEYLTRRHTDHAVWQRCGSFGTLSCFSFYANKLITTGEGGMVLTDDPLLAEKARSMRNLCFQPQRRFLHESLGFNFRLTNLQAALGLPQVDRLEAIVKRKRWMATEYHRRLASVPTLQRPVEEPWARNVYWMYGIVLAEDARCDARRFAAELRAHGVDTRPFFLGMHEQPAFHERGLFLGECHPVSEKLARQGVYLPSGVSLSEEQLSQVCDTVSTVLS